MLANGLQTFSGPKNIHMEGNNFSARIVLDKRYRKKGNLYALVVRVIVNRKPFNVPLHHSIEEKYWLEEKEQVSTDCKTIRNITRLNNYMLKKKTVITDRLLALEEEDLLSTLPLLDIKQRVSGRTRKSKGLMLLAYLRVVIQQKEAEEKFSAAAKREQLLSSLIKFLSGRDLLLKQVNYTWLEKYDAWYLAQGNCLNGLSFYLRTLRNIFKVAIKAKLLDPKYYPFSEYKIKTEETRKRALKQADLKKFMDFAPQTPEDKKAKGDFLIMFYLMGINFADLCRLRISDIRDSRIEYKRGKTKKLYSILIHAKLKKLLAPYITGKKDNDYIFDVITSEDAKKQHNEINNALYKYNGRLKEIGKLCGIKTKITSYVSRHTFATLAKYLGIPASVIKEYLGHSTEQQTQTYLDSFENEVLDHHHAVMLETLDKQFEDMESGQPDKEKEKEKIRTMVGESGIPLERWKQIIAGLTTTQSGKEMFAA